MAKRELTTNKVFLDTAYAIALSVESDEHHERAEELAEYLEAEQTRLVTTRAILLEIGNALSKKRYRQAAVELLNALEQDPQVEIIPLSEELFDQALELFRNRPDKEWGQRAVGYSNFNQTDQAIKDDTSAIKINPQFKEAHLERAFACQSIDEPEKAAADQQRAEELGELPTRRLIAELNGKIEAAAAFDPQTASLYRSRGASFAHLHEFEPALADYARAVQIKPDFIDAYCERSQINCRLNQTEGAIADYTRIIEITPDNTFIRNLRAGIFLNLQQIEPAISDYTRIIEIDPDNDSAFSKRAIAYRATGEDEKAAADSERFESLRAEMPLREIGKYTNLIEAGSDDPEVLSGHLAERANLYYQIGNFEKAIEDYTSAIALDPDYEDFFFMRAKAYEAIGETAKADKDRKHLSAG